MQSVVDKKNRVLSNEALTDSSAKLTRGSDYYYNLLRDFYSVNSSSRVVDENGEPMQVYHGSDDDFDVFDKTKTHSNMHYWLKKFPGRFKSYEAVGNDSSLSGKGRV